MPKRKAPGTGKSLDQLRHELATQGRLLPPADVLSPAPSPSPGPAQDTIPAEEWEPPEPQLVRTRKEQRQRKLSYVTEREADQAGHGCACGTETGQVCGIHVRIGHRRSLRPD
jgi:hypothetical protein